MRFKSAMFTGWLSMNLALAISVASGFVWSDIATAGVNGQNGGNGGNGTAGTGGGNYAGGLGGQGSNHGATDGSANDGGLGQGANSDAFPGQGAGGSGGAIYGRSGRGGDFADFGVGGGGSGGAASISQCGGGGGGGGGGGLGGTLTSSNLDSSTNFVGGNGGAGGAGGYTPIDGNAYCIPPGDSGGAGGGGAGLWMHGGLSLTNNATIQGGSGGGGGTGLLVAGGGSILVNNSSISGGSPGGAGIALSGGSAAAPNQVTNNGNINAGSGGDGLDTDSMVVLTNAGSNTIAGSNGVSGGESQQGGSGGSGLLLTASANSDTSTVNNAGSLTGGNGGAGGDDCCGDGGPGGSGGAGGGGALLTHADLTNSGKIIGGIGGGAGNGGNNNGGNPGASGVGLTLSAGTASNSGGIAGGNGVSGDDELSAGNGATGVLLQAGTSLTNNGSVQGGNGGIQYPEQGDPIYGGDGNGGAGVVGKGNTTVTNSGTITGGAGGYYICRFKGCPTPTNNAVNGDAIDFSSGGNTLILENGSSITGNVVAGSSDKLELGGNSVADGGTGNGAFDVTTIGATQQYRNFGAFAKVGSSTWTLSGSNTGATPWSVSAGTLAGTASIGSLSNGGSVAPGSAATPYGTLTVVSFSQAAAGTLQIAATNGSNAKLASTGAASLGGTLSVSFTTVPSAGQKYTVLSASSLSGTFSNVIVAAGALASQVDYGVTTANAVTVSFNGSTVSYSIGGSVSGASAPLQLTLTGSNPANTQTMSSTNGSFTFATSLLGGSGWNVAATSSSGQSCSVGNGSGTNLSGSVNNVAVNCVNQYTVTAAAPAGHGTITPASQTVASGNAASFTVTPNTGFEVLNVSGDTCTVTQQGTSNTWISSAITQACVVTAVFADYPSQCGGAVNYVPTFFDDFSGNVLDPAKWTAYPHGGNLVVASDSVAVSAGTGFPYVASAGSPILPLGDFSVRWIATYAAQQSNGTGSLALASSLPVDGASSWGNIADAWQDGNGYRVEVSTNAGSVTNAYSVQPPVQVQHDVEYCWLAGTTEVWVDGVREMQATRNTNVPRPAALWFGNPGGTSAGPWQPFTLYYVEVRALNDRIFANGFETP